jgi:hypothetical protein
VRVRVRRWVVDARSPLALGVLAVFVASGLAALASFLIKVIGPAGSVPGYGLAIAGGICFVLGVLAGWAGTRWYYRLHLTTQSVLVRSLEAALDLARARLAALEPDRESLRRFGVYHEHVLNIIDALIKREVSFENLAGDEVELWICGMTEKFIEEGVRHDVLVSIWIESPLGPIREQVRRIPGGDRFLGSFEIVCGPRLTSVERKAFEVHIDPSWLKHNCRYEDEQQRPRTYAADELTLVGRHSGPDIDAFSRHGYQSVRAASFRRNETRGYIVVLSRMPQGFSQVEDRYVLFLKYMFELDEAIRSGALPN